MTGPHQGQQVVTTGASLGDAKGAVVMVHGRGATAESILTLAPALRRPEFAYLAPQAAGGAWYPNGFMAPIASNEPGITSGLRAIDDVLSILQAEGIPPERTVLLGFSQGACLSLEYAARNARRYGAVATLSGGLIGPDGTPRDYAGSMDGTPVFLGCSDVDFHIPAQRVEASAEVMRGLGADVTLRLYPGMGHTVNEDEIAHVQAILDGIAKD
ncbi:alpha/beta hydrolase [Longimicrobium sp.]|uniref:alpha/beta hydrolase n=1 Tax=Longimicrobium sp. TaxID=2029185 RepID=UPI002E31250B|nr:dienelactone hydrolase family protein [Longimicrobium sp.]HEX6040481.1 dienelactone hydrolase family protein [Longimicrobium sp.]